MIPNGVSMCGVRPILSCCTIIDAENVLKMAMQSKDSAIEPNVGLHCTT